MHLQVVSDVNDSEWTFVIKSWPNGGENKRVYVMEKTGTPPHNNACTACIMPIIGSNAAHSTLHAVHACMHFVAEVFQCICSWIHAPEQDDSWRCHRHHT